MKELLSLHLEKFQAGHAGGGSQNMSWGVGVRKDTKQVSSRFFIENFVPRRSWYLENSREEARPNPNLKKSKKKMTGSCYLGKFGRERKRKRE